MLVLPVQRGWSGKFGASSGSETPHLEFKVAIDRARGILAFRRELYENTRSQQKRSNLLDVGGTLDLPRLLQGWTAGDMGAEDSQHRRDEDP